MANKTVKPKTFWRQNKDQTLVRVRYVDESGVQFYNAEGPRKLKDFVLPDNLFLERFTREFSPDELDAEWHELAKNHDEVILPLEQRFQEVCEEYEALLVTLREYAQRKLEAETIRETEQICVICQKEKRTKLHQTTGQHVCLECVLELKGMK